MRTDVALQPGQALQACCFLVTRSDLLRYAAASGDDNPIHRDDAAARAVGLPGVVAHGMYTMALAARALDEWAGDPGRVLRFGCRFARPVLVPDGPDGADGTVVTVSGAVRRVDEEGIHVSLEATCAGRPVLAAARAVLAC